MFASPFATAVPGFGTTLTTFDAATAGGMPLYGTEPPTNSLHASPLLAATNGSNPIALIYYVCLACVGRWVGGWAGGRAGECVCVRSVGCSSCPVTKWRDTHISTGAVSLRHWCTMRIHHKTNFVVISSFFKMPKLPPFYQGHYFPRHTCERILTSLPGVDRFQHTESLSRSKIDFKKPRMTWCFLTLDWGSVETSHGLIRRPRMTCHLNMTVFI